MVHKIEYKDRYSGIDCYLPERAVPDKNATAELHRMTALEETLERLAALPDFFQGGRQRIERKSRGDAIKGY